MWEPQEALGRSGHDVVVFGFGYIRHQLSGDSGEWSVTGVPENPREITCPHESRLRPDVRGIEYPALTADRFGESTVSPQHPPIAATPSDLHDLANIANRSGSITFSNRQLGISK